MDNTERSIRLDTAEIDTKFDITDEGYLTGYAIVSNIGVFSYRTKDGKLRKEARKPEHVFHEDAIKSFFGKPVTNEHPGLVNPETAKVYAVGSIGNTYKQDGIHLALPITIWDKKTIEDIKKGKRALSLGYTSKDIPNTKQDVFLGMEYDYEQTEITGNHVAVIQTGRAGSRAKIRLDGVGAPIEIDEVKENIMAEAVMKSIHLDGIDYQAEERVILALKSAEKDASESKAKLDSLDADKVKIEAERDSLKVKLDSVEKELADLKGKDVIAREEVGKLVQARIELEKTAALFKVEVKADMADLDIKKAVILSTDKEAKLDSDVYVQARFDILVADAKKSVKEDEDVRSLGVDIPAKEDKQEPVSLSAARSKLDSILASAHKPKVKE